MWTYNLQFTPAPDMDLRGWLGDIRSSMPGPRGVNRKAVTKRRAANTAARAARKAQRNKGLGKVKWSWSPGPNGRGVITERQGKR